MTAEQQQKRITTYSVNWNDLFMTVHTQKSVLLVNVH